MLQVAFDAAAEAMLIIDKGRQIHWANQSAAALLVNGVPIQVMNRALMDLVQFRHPDGEWIAADHPLQCRGETLPMEGAERFELLLSSGQATAIQEVRWKPVEMIQAPHLLITIRDLSPEQKALQQQQQFMTNLTHELRTPLTIVSGSLRRLQRQDDLDRRAVDYIDRASEEVTRIHRLLEHLSLMTRLEIDPSLLGVRDQPLKPCFEQWLASCPADRRERLRINWCLPKSCSDHRFDANALRIVLDQLLDNAIHHGQVDEPIDVSVEWSETRSHSSLVVTSRGIQPLQSMRDLEQWRQPFFRGVAVHEGDHVENPGLGLALVDQLVAAWGGELRIDQYKEKASAQVTMTRVIVTLPISSEAVSAESQPGA